MIKKSILIVAIAACSTNLVHASSKNLFEFEATPVVHTVRVEVPYELGGVNGVGQCNLSRTRVHCYLCGKDYPQGMGHNCVVRAEVYSSPAELTLASKADLLPKKNLFSNREKLLLPMPPIYEFPEANSLPSLPEGFLLALYEEEVKKSSQMKLEVAGYKKDFMHLVAAGHITEAQIKAIPDDFNPEVYAEENNNWIVANVDAFKMSRNKLAAFHYARWGRDQAKK